MVSQGDDGLETRKMHAISSTPLSQCQCAVYCIMTFGRLTVTLGGELEKEETELFFVVDLGQKAVKLSHE